jgi:hypothetical protein
MVYMKKNILILILLVLVGVGGWRLFGKGTLSQTYSNEALKFQVNYPKEWHADDNCKFDVGGIIGFGMEENLILCSSDAPPGGPITFSGMIVSAMNPDLSEYIGDFERGIGEAKKKEITVGGIKATRVSGKTLQHEGPGPKAGLEEEVVIFANNGIVYTLVYLPIDDRDFSKVFDRMLASFKFI